MRGNPWSSSGELFWFLPKLHRRTVLRCSRPSSRRSGHFLNLFTPFPHFLQDPSPAGLPSEHNVGFYHHFHKIIQHAQHSASPILSHLSSFLHLMMSFLNPFVPPLHSGEHFISQRALCPLQLYNLNFSVRKQKKEQLERKLKLKWQRKKLLSFLIYRVM